MNDARIYTLGHSNLEIDVFLKLLHQFRIPLLMDVRSRPQSARFPQFNKEELEPALRDAGISYLALGEELGGRPGDPKAYRSDGQVDYKARRKSREFQLGIDSVLAALAKGPLALLCAEEDPLECHRFLLISWDLAEKGLSPLHIRRGGRLETQGEAEDRLLRENDFGDVTSDALFAMDRGAALEEAYGKQAARVAFRIDPRVLETY